MIKRPSTHRFLPFYLLTVLAALQCLPGCQSGAAADSPTSPAKPIDVSIVSPEKHDVSRLIELPSDVQPIQEAVLYAKTAGYLQRILVDKGDSVKAGQLLAVIQAPELLADKAQAASSYDSEVFKTRSSVAAQGASVAVEHRAEASASQAKAEYDRASSNIQNVEAQVADAKEAVNQAKAEQVQAAADLEATNAEVAQAEANVKAAHSERVLADATYKRYRGIYDRDSQLIALQDVQTAQTSAEVAQSKSAAAESQLVVMQKHVLQAEAQQHIVQSKLNRSKAQLAEADAQLRMARSEVLAQAEHLNAIRHDVDAARQQNVAAAANVSQSQKQADAFGNASKKSSALSDYANIVAPFAGTITSRSVDAGAFIQAASTTMSAAAIVTVSDLSSVRFYLHVPESEASFVRVGTEVRLSLSTGMKSVLKGRVSRTSDALDPKTRTLLAEVDLSNSGHKILPGAYALGKVVLETHPNVLSLPSKAVGTEKSGRFVWVLDGSKAKHVSVKAGFNDGERTEITDGLKGDEHVVADKLDAITPGAPIQAVGTAPSKKTSNP